MTKTLASPCMSQEEYDRAVKPLTDEDKAWLRSLGWVEPHAVVPTSCASGCSHCLVCDDHCNADWGLYT